MTATWSISFRSIAPDARTQELLLVGNPARLYEF